MSLTNYYFNDYYNKVNLYTEKEISNDINNEIKNFNKTKISNMIEYINNEEYIIKEQEEKFNIFDDITYVNKNKNNELELVINIKKRSDLLSINKIKLSNNIKNYIKKIYLSINDRIIINDLFNDESSNTYYMEDDIALSIIIDSVNLNNIMNTNIYILFSYINYKNKVKHII